MNVKLTVRTIEATAPAASEVIVWDSELRGFGLRVSPAGRKSFILFYRTREGQQRKPTIGSYPALRPEAARVLAKQMLADAAKGGDPSASRKEARAAANVSELCDRYMREHAETRKKASSIKGDRRLIDVHILPAMGSRKVAAVTRANVAALHHALAATPYEANRTLALLSKMFTLAERWGLRPDKSNPAHNIDRYKEEKRERFLSPDETARLWHVLNNQPPTPAVDAIKLLVLTGRRLGEVLALQWHWIDLDLAMLSLPDSKTGALRVPLAANTVALLQEIQSRQGADAIYIIPGHVRGQPLVNLQKPWRRIRALAGLEDVRLHDLRHTYASVAAAAGLSLPMIGKLLGHTQAATTARYAHLANDPVRDAAELIADAMTKMQVSQ